MKEICAVCSAPILTSDADCLVKTDAGPVHPECFDGPFPPGQEPASTDDNLWLFILGTDDDLRRGKELADLFGW